MFVKIKNRSAHPVILKSSLGDAIQINAGVIKEVSEEFLTNYDRSQIQVLTPSPAIIVNTTEEAAKEEVKAPLITPSEGVREEATSKDTKKSK